MKIIACLVLWLSTSAMASSPSDGSYPITVVDHYHQETFEISASSLKFWEEPAFMGGYFGRIYFENKTVPQSPKRMISTNMPWNGMFLHEALLEAASKGPVTIFLQKPALLDGSRYQNYLVADITVKTGDSAELPLSSMLWAKKREQEKLNKRYFGLIAQTRRLYDFCASKLTARER